MTVRDYIGLEAQKLGIPASLALAMVDQESAGTQKAVSPKGATGLFQLMPETAKSLGVDPNDPFDNIRGGLTYFKQQLDAHKGDVRLALAAYNAGPGRTADGRVPHIPETQEYVQKILGRWQQGDAPSAVPGAPQNAPPAVPGAPPSPQVQPQGENTGTVTSALTKATGIGAAPPWYADWDPRTFRGRVNLAGTAAGTVAGLATRNPVVGAGARAGVTTAAVTAVRTGIAPWIVRVLGPPVAAGLAGGSQAQAEKMAGTAPADTSAVGEGLQQGAYEALGQTFMWPVRRIGSAFAASAVGKQATEAVSERLSQVRSTTKTAIQAVQDRISEAKSAIGMVTKAVTDAQRGRAAVTANAAAGAVRTVGAPQTATAIGRIVQQELDDASELARLNAIENNLLKNAPSVLKVGAVTKEALEGPVRQALKIAGQRVGEAAEQGPALPLRPAQEAIAEVAERFRPSEIFGETAAAEMGFTGRSVAPSVGARPAAAATGSYITPEEFRAAMRGAYDPATRQITNIAAIPGVLGKFQQLTGDTIPFDVMHSMKMILQGMVNYDHRAKQVMEKITKGAAAKIRGQMAGFQPYDDATAAFSALIPTYTKGVGKRLFDLAKSPDGAEQIAKGLTGNASQATVIKSLLIDQAAAGGNPQLGQQAWDAVRDVYTYDNLLRGGIDGLEQRVQRFVTENADFNRVVYGDLSGQHIINNLDQLGKAFRTVTEGAAERRLEGSAAVEAAKRRYLRVGQKEAATAIKGTKTLQDELKRSSVGRIQSREEKIADFMRGTMLGPFTFWGAMSLVRLFESAKGPELLRWAAYSNRNTQRVVKLLLGTGGERALAGATRTLDDQEETKQLFNDLAPFMAEQPSR